MVDTLEQELHDRRPVHGGGLVHHSAGVFNTCPFAIPSDWGRQVSCLLSEVLADSYDNALAETINGLYKAEVIHRRGPRRKFEAVEFARLEWVDWFNHRRLLEPIGNIPTAEPKSSISPCWTHQPSPQKLNEMASGKLGAVQNHDSAFA